MMKAAYRAPALPDGVVAGMLDVIEARRRSLAAI